jgi:hypothetical protein
MCIENKIALDTINNFIAVKPNFTFSQLLNEIKNKGGIFRVAPGYSVRDYVQELVDAKVIEYDFIQDRFNVVSHNEIEMA